jgi:salicylate hydroxylase
VVLESGREIEADLVVGADGINSKLREVMLRREDPAIPTGDLAYRLLLSTSEMMKDPELASLVTDPQVNYWLGPDMHAVNYVLKGGKLFNMVLLVPDDSRYFLSYFVPFQIVSIAVRHVPHPKPCHLLLDQT